MANLSRAPVQVVGPAPAQGMAGEPVHVDPGPLGCPPGYRVGLPDGLFWLKHEPPALARDGEPVRAQRGAMLETCASAGKAMKEGAPSPMIE